MTPPAPISCIACRHTEHRRIADAHQRRTMMRCTRCKLIFVVPQWTDHLAQDIFRNYEGWPGGLSGGAAERREIMCRIARSILARKPHGGRLLDVGCANGMFFDVMRSEFESVTRRHVPLQATAAACRQRRGASTGSSRIPSGRGYFNRESTSASNRCEHATSPMIFSM